MNRIAAIALGSTMALATPGAGQTIPSPFEYIERRQEVGIMGGVLSSGTGRFGYAPSGGPVVGLRYGLELSGPLGLEGGIGLVNGERDVVDPSQLEENRIIGQADALLTTIDARIRFSFAGRRTWHSLSPFLSFGGGVVFDSSNRSPLDDTLLPEDVYEFGTSFYGMLGLGSRWFLTDRLALRGEGMFSLWQADTPPGYSDPNRGFEQVEDGEWLRGTALTVTLLWRW